MGSVTLTASKAKYRTNFGPMLPSVYHSFYGDFDYIEEVLFQRMVSPTEVAAIVVERYVPGAEVGQVYVGFPAKDGEPREGIKRKHERGRAGLSVLSC